MYRSVSYLINSVTRYTAIQKLTWQTASTFSARDGCGHVIGPFFRLFWSSAGDLCAIMSSVNFIALGRYCRYVISKMSLCRFLYVRYASGLVKDGISLLHQLADLYFAVYCTNWSLLFFFHFLSNYENFLKIKFCAQHNVTVLIEEDFTANSLKPKMILIATGLLFLTCLTFSYASALKSR